MATNGKAATVKFTLDGKDVEALPGETIWQVARRHGIDIPHFCSENGHTLEASIKTETGHRFLIRKSA